MKVQNLAGNTLMSRFHLGFEIELPFVRMSYHEILSNFSKTPAWCPTLPSHSWRGPYLCLVVH